MPIAAPGSLRPLGRQPDLGLAVAPSPGLGDQNRRKRLCWPAVEGQDEVIREIETRLLESLGRFGVAGTVRIDEGRAVLEGNGPAVSTDVSALVEQWAQLSLPERERGCTDASRRLAAERRGKLGSRHVEPRSGIGATVVWVAGLMGAVGLLAVGAVLLRWFGARPTDDQAAATVDRRRADAAVSDFERYEREREARSARACLATSTRVARGGTVSPADTEGWVVEVALLREQASSDLSVHPALDQFIARESGRSMGRFIWPEASELAGVDGATARVVVRSAGLRGGGTRSWRGVTLSFTGKYVRPYFAPEQRFVYQRVAYALARSLEATHAGVYARCATGSLHQLGSWFQGPSAGEAAGAMVYFMGVVNGRGLDGGKGDHRDGGPAPVTADLLEQILTATAGLDRTRIATVLGSQNGMISGPKGGPATISFPFRDGNRATRCSHQVTRFLGLQ